MTMREILFRGKRVKPVALVSHWIFGYYVFKADKSLPGLGKHFIVVHDGFGLSQWVEVDGNTVGQYTGLMDKDGTKIFEGDIVQLLDTGEVGCCIYRYSGFELSSGGCGCSLCVSSATERVIIGNFYDNPELMEG